MDAVEPKRLKAMCEQAILAHFDEDLHEDLKEKEAEERKIYQQTLKTFVNDLKVEQEKKDKK